ncbi:capsular polysaccharide biosynthsis protein [Neobacillus bataviensis LMG 21833]|uniref:Capsular polysaccharide biosynthsis protein n=1 Tax=Neobacillus bataviensis LMG 21833 TaxID=1117379 RepID=K6CE25_9BACI|nr:glycosyltransferase [Neobacillus bataviensis]EKN69395.1 capsular polysaccharide biosynthsis protein [Neobacillus bataviensis LMG 21833]
MKKDMLFVIDSLNCAGAEKSLISLLTILDYSKFNVDLMLFGHEGILQGLVPKEVNILTPLKYTEFTKMNLKKAVIYSLKKKKVNMLTSRINYSIKIRKQKYSHAEEARLFWESAGKVIEKRTKVYDIAISYAQGIPTFYVAEKVKSKKKYAWVNVSYRLNDKEKGFQKKFYDQFNKIVAVSPSAKEIFLETFPCYSNNVEVIYDINNSRFIFEMANLGEAYEDDFDGLRILTIGRLAHQKGYDIALAACKKLKEKGIHFRWYALGIGPLYSEINEYIIKNELSEHFILLGIKVNPYPFIKSSDIYVQTSKFEGFGLAIAEARMLNKPIVTTRFDAVFNQMIDRKNGLVVDMNADAVCDGILKLIGDEELTKSITQFLSNEKKGNIEEIEKFYHLIG